jgi:hypothetical protein
MVPLSIDLQDGFKDDSVIIRINDEVVFDQHKVTTKMLTGLAGSINSDVQPGPVRININVETKRITGTISLVISEDTFLGISIINGKIVHLVSGTPFGYL